MTIQRHNPAYRLAQTLKDKKIIEKALGLMFPRPFLRYAVYRMLRLLICWSISLRSTGSGKSGSLRRSEQRHGEAPAQWK